MLAMKRLTNAPLGEATIAFYWAVYLGMLISHTHLSLHDGTTFWEILRYCSLLAAAPAYLCAYSRKLLYPPAHSSGPQLLGCKEHRQEITVAPKSLPGPARAVAFLTWVPIITFPLAVYVGNAAVVPHIVAFVLVYAGWAIAAVLTLMVAFSKRPSKEKLWLIARAVPLAAAVPLTNSMPLPP